MDENNAVSIALSIIRWHYGESEDEPGDDADDSNHRNPWNNSVCKALKTRRISEEMNANTGFLFTFGHNVPCYVLLQSHSECRRAGPGREHEGDKEATSENKQISARAQAEYSAFHCAYAEY